MSIILITVSYAWTILQMKEHGKEHNGIFIFSILNIAGLRQKKTLYYVESSFLPIKIWEGRTCVWLLANSWVMRPKYTRTSLAPRIYFRLSRSISRRVNVIPSHRIYLGLFFFRYGKWCCQWYKMCFILREIQKITCIKKKAESTGEQPRVSRKVSP